ncbi:MAG: TetR/AcrR family transcriptional regulator [Leptolyngbya sp. SIO4C1]|nr:TetR/AcrR family transcriptional regulator [Leptolyngbya sp. SIO4C1]
MASRAGKVEQILAVAQRLAQERGYNAFSYADIAAEVGIRRAAIHYHFPSKSDLGQRLVSRYREAYRQCFQQIDRETTDPREKLKRYIQLDWEMLQAERMCLCGMLSAELKTLPDPITEEVRAFFAEHEQWLAGILQTGAESGVLRYAGTSAAAAQVLLAGLEGAMLIARSQGDQASFQVIAQQLLKGLGVDA